MPRLSDASRLRRREEIAAAAMRCFAREGFAGTSMADIISEAGSSAGSVYSNFSSKADLVSFAAATALRDLIAPLEGEVPSEPTLADVLAHLLRPNADRDRAQTLLQIWAEVPRDRELEDIARHSLKQLHASLRTALLPRCRHVAGYSVEQAAAAADAGADVVLTAVQGYLVRITIDREIDVTVLAERLTDTFRILDHVVSPAPSQRVTP